MLPEESSLPPRHIFARAPEGARRTPFAGAVWLVVLVCLGLGCDSSSPLETGPSDVRGSAQDAGRNVVRVDASPAPAAPGLDARVVLPIADPDPVQDGAVSAPRDAAARDGALADAGLASTPCFAAAVTSCGNNEFCSREDPSSGLGCGVDDSAGSCVVRPGVCTAPARPVCGCDLKTYDNDCEAHAAGVSVAKLGACGPPNQVGCDARTVTCKRARPSCPDGQVPAVVDTCWGECVTIEQCTCKEADACPERETYVCHMSRGRCGPYVN